MSGEGVEGVMAPLSSQPAMVGRWSSSCVVRDAEESRGLRRTVLTPGHVGAGPPWFIQIG